MLTLVEIILASLIAGVLDTVAGFGGALLLVPILVLVVGSHDAVLLSALIPLGWNSVRMWMLREWINWKIVGLFALGIVPGALFAGHYLEAIDPEILRRAIGAVLILFGSYYVARLYFDLPDPRGMKPWGYPVLGLVTGAIGAILGAGHGPLQSWGLAAGGLSPREIISNNGAIGGITALARLGGYAIAGSLHSGLWFPAALGFLAGAAGAVYGVRLSLRARDTTLELVIGAALLLAGVRMVL
jgi:uncharacterized membrane protein YfcA